MDPEHKIAIQKNFLELIKRARIDDRFMKKLISRGVFHMNFIASIPDPEDKARTLFTEIQKRGPHAFRHLIEVCQETGQLYIAKLLDKKGEFAAAAPAKHMGGAVSFQPADYQLEYHFDISNSEQPLKVEVIHSTAFMEDIKNATLVYNTTSKHRGIALIVNFTEVMGHRHRTGSEHDIASLRELFTQIGLEVDVSTDPESLLEVVSDFANNPELKKYDVIMLVIMSHGKHINNQEYIVGTRGDLVSTKDIERYFYNNNQNVYLKPKIIMYQICRGNLKDDGVDVPRMTESMNRRIETDGVPPTQRDVTISDTLIVHSTLPGFASHRDIKMGTWFIQLFCKTAMEHAHNKTFEDIIKLTSSSLRQQRSHNNQMQSCEYINRGFKRLYLHPGIYKDGEKICLL